MPCFQPLQAWSTKHDGYHKPAIKIGRVAPSNHAEPLALPCGRCMGCAMAQAKAWALRCQLELQTHTTAILTTLTYDRQHLPVTLTKRHLQLFLKRLRRSVTDRTVRFFAAGEYGETNRRPHYHAILYGLALEHAKLIEDTWGLGHAHTDPVTPDRIAYVAGYTSKKLGWHQLAKRERVDPETGEVYTWQPPFIQMSRRPGIGNNAKQYIQSWRTYAISNGQKQPVPRYLHEAWKQQATTQELEQLAKEKQTVINQLNITPERLEAMYQIALSKQAIRADKRHL